MDDILGGFEDPESSDASAGTGDAEVDDAIAGFDEAEEPEVVEPPAVAEHTEASEERRWSLQGDASFGFSASIHDHDSPAGIDYSGVQRLRMKLALQLDFDLPKGWKLRSSGYGFYDAAYALQGRGEYPDDVLDTHEWDLERTDTYVEGSLHERVDLKLGRQVVNWGRSESIRVLDIVNPLDNREPGLVDIEDMRRSLAMLKLGFFAGPWTLTVLAIPEVRYDLLPGNGSDYMPDVAGSIPSTLLELAFLRASLSAEKQGIFDRLFPIAGGGLAGLSELEDHVGDDFGRASEYAMNLTGVFSGWDVSLQVASYSDDIAHFDDRDLRLEHSRLWMIGSGANYTVGSWLFKAEIAYIDGFEFLWAEDEKSRIDAMVGIEYYGISDVNIVFEVAERHIVAFEDSMELFLDSAQEDTLESALRISVDLLNDQVHITALGLAIGEKAQDGSLVRLSVEYDVMDALSVEAGLLLFEKGDNVFFADSAANDRFFAGVKYSF